MMIKCLNVNNFHFLWEAKKRRECGWEITFALFLHLFLLILAPSINLLGLFKPFNIIQTFCKSFYANIFNFSESGKRNLHIYNNPGSKRKQSSRKCLILNYKSYAEWRRDSLKRLQKNGKKGTAFGIQFIKVQLAM